MAPLVSVPTSVLPLWQVVTIFVYSWNREDGPPAALPVHELLQTLAYARLEAERKPGYLRS